MPVNLFKTAPSVSIGHPRDGKTGGKNGERVTVELGDDLTTLASVKVLMKAMERLAATYDEKVKAKMADEFAKQALATGKRPKNFVGVSAKAEASCELRKRSSSSPLSDEEAAMLRAMDVPVTEDVVCEAVPERFFFNPRVVANDELARKISAALSVIPELNGMDVLLRQEARPAETRLVVSDEALDAVAATQDLEMIKQLLPMVSSLAIRAKMVSSEVGEAMAILKTAELAL